MVLAVVAVMSHRLVMMMLRTIVLTGYDEVRRRGRHCGGAGDAECQEAAD
jgi:hypothetical protein